MSNLFYEQLQEQSDGVDLKKFAIKELNKVQEELEEIYQIKKYGINSSRGNGKSIRYGIFIAQEIINKHIDELKGENNDQQRKSKADN